MNKVVISLGWNCEPAEIRWEFFNRTRMNGYLSCPFDLCVTPYTSLLETLEDNFIEDKFFNLYITSDGWIHNEYGTRFNHESIPTYDTWKLLGDQDYFTKDDFVNFKERYRRRINNFRNYTSGNFDVLFILNHPLADVSHLIPLLDRLGCNYNLAVIDDMNLQSNAFQRFYKYDFSSTKINSNKVEKYNIRYYDSNIYERISFDFKEYYLSENN